MQNNITKLKEMYVDYYADVPVQKYAAMSIGRDEDTIIRWKKEDGVFADSVEKAKAEWIRRRLLTTKAEFALERLEKSVFSEKSTIEVGSANTLKPIDPNTPENINLANESLRILMELTRAT